MGVMPVWGSPSPQSPSAGGGEVLIFVFRALTANRPEVKGGEGT